MSYLLLIFYNSCIYMSFTQKSQHASIPNNNIIRTTKPTRPIILLLHARIRPNNAWTAAQAKPRNHEQQQNRHNVQQSYPPTPTMSFSPRNPARSHVQQYPCTPSSSFSSNLANSSSKRANGTDPSNRRPLFPLSRKSSIFPIFHWCYWKKGK